MRNSGGLRGAVLTTIIAIGFACVVVLSTNAAPAGAQGTCADNFGQFDVSTADELNFAIGCFNSASFDDDFRDVHVVLLNDIEADAVAGDSVFVEFTQQGQNDFTIEGARHTIRRSATAPQTSAPLFSVAPGSGTTMLVFETDFEVGPADTFALHNDGEGSSIRMWASSIAAGPGGTSATAIYAGSETNEHSILWSWFDGVAIGLATGSPAYDISSTTINAADIDIVAAADAGIGVVTTSTLAGPIGVQAGNSRIDIANSTVLGDGAFFPPGADGGVLIRSSIVGSCSSPELDINGQDGGGYVDQGNNVGGCFDAGVVIDTVLADNGCEYPTPRGCAPTVALSADSPAIGAGDCIDINNGTFVDQRGADRSPLGPGCDAGSFEFDSLPPLCPSANGTFEISTAAELNAAIDCFNQADRGAPDYSITLLNDIEVDTVATTAVVAEIDPSFGNRFAIYGQGFTLRRSAAADTAPLPLIRLDSFERTDFLVENLNLELGRNDTAAIQGERSIDLVLLQSSITTSVTGSTATGILIDGQDAAATLLDSFIDQTAVGVQFRGDRLELERSTIVSTQTDLDIDMLNVQGLQGAGVFNSTLGGPVGIRLVSGLAGVDNSTILGDGGVSGGSGFGFITVRSSIVHSCSLPQRPYDGANPPQSGQNILVGEGNVGRCFGPGSTVEQQLADNGCRVATPAGCPPTVRIWLNSPARGAGDCVGGLAASVDQRNEPRDLPCDSGSYEYQLSERCLHDLFPRDPRTNFTVSTATEFNQAIACFNQPTDSLGGVDINLQADIDADALADGAVFEPVASDGRRRIVINGNGFTIRRSPNADTTSLPVLSFSFPTGDAKVEINDLRIEVGEFDSHGIHSSGNDVELSVAHSAIEAVTTDSNAIGIKADHQAGETFIFVTTIDNFRIGAQVDGDVATISLSTITSTGTDISSPRPTFLLVGLSTLTAPIGISSESGTVIVAGATIVGDGAAGSPAGNSTFRIRTSIVGSCSAPIAAEAGTSSVVLDDGENVGGCFNAGQSMDTELADNGCVEATPSGCTKTIALSLDAAARGAGFCGTLDFLEAITIDQRGFPRSPLGPGCDAGAYEDLACNGAGPNFSVATEGELNTAVACFNAASNAGEYVITVTDDITLTESYRTTQLFTTYTSLWPINQSRSDLTLRIDGGGNQLSTSVRVSSLLVTHAENQAPLVIENLHVVQDLVGRSSLRIEGTAPTTVRNTAFTSATDTRADFAIVDGPGPLTVENAELVGDTGGISTGAGSLTITNSTVSGSLVAVNAQLANSVDIVNSTLSGDASALRVGGATTGTVRHVTVNSSGTILASAATPSAVLVTSSYFTGQCPQFVETGTGNVGSCFGGISVGEPLPLADNGCLVATPAGCVPTAAIDADSIALGAGICDAVATDQRGEPRTPLGDGCDAGAYELPGFVPSDPILGDVDDNGTVDNDDVQALLTYLAGGSEPAGIDVADVNDDGEIRLDDALLLAQTIADPG